MPQMNPMNWIMIFLFVNLIFMAVLVKIHFLGKAINTLNMTEVKQNELFNFKLEI